MLQNIIVGIIVLAALAYVVFKLRRQAKGGGCGCGCSGCDGGENQRDGSLKDFRDPMRGTSEIPECCQGKQKKK